MIARFVKWVRALTAPTNAALVVSDVAQASPESIWPQPLPGYRAPIRNEEPSSSRARILSNQEEFVAKFALPPSVMWMVDANVVEQRKWGPGGAEVRRGSRLLRGGSKVHISQMLRTPGKYWVVGRHRKTNQYLTQILDAALITNLRIELVRSPHVIAQHWCDRPRGHAYGKDEAAAASLLCEVQKFAEKEDLL